MQLKGLVKIFTIALIIISLYQLSFTFVVRNVEKKTKAKAERLALAEKPGINGEELEILREKHYDALIDSLQGETVMNILVKKFTYQDAKEQELKLGLDLQGGMNVTLDVSLDELIRTMSNNPKDEALNKAIKDADFAKASSQKDFVTLFGESFIKNNPDRKLAYLFTSPSEKEITQSSSNEDVLRIIHREADEAIKRTYNILYSRIDKFGVVNPNINLDLTRGIITVELAGVRDPERVRNYLQATAKLEFFETYSNFEIYNSLQAANDALAIALSADKSTAAAVTVVADTAKATTTPANDTAVAAANPTAKEGDLAALNASDNSLSSLTADSATADNDSLAKKNPLFAVWFPNVTNENTLADGPVVGYVMKKDTALLNKYLNMDIVKNKFPSNVKFLYGAENKKDRLNAKAPLILYAIKTAPGTKGAKLEGDHVINAQANTDPMTGQWLVSMEMNATGARIWKKMTGDNIGKSVAVVLDDRVYSAPVVQNEIAGGNTQISGNFSAEDADDLAKILKTGKLPAPARIVQEQVVGPTLGAESINAGVNSLAISFVVIFALMLLYYNTGGIVANIALILNLLITIGILAALGATLTMPGIAGLVLTIGMAVDTNVIVFERIKEELAIGKTYQQAVEDGYKRSYAPVLDGHISQFITAVILFVFGLGPVKGFAYTQMWGLILSVFCGLLVSRIITDMYTKRERHFKYFTKLSTSIFKKAHFKFIEARKYTYIISTVILLAGVASFFHGFDYGVEFAGGRSYTVKFAEKHTVTEIKDKLKKHLGDEYPVVKTIGTLGNMNITTTYLIDQGGQEVTDRVRKQLYEGLKAESLIPSTVSYEEFTTRYVDEEKTVLPTISDDLKKGAMYATILAVTAIFIYILVRFRKWQYSLGTIIAILHDVLITFAVFSFFKDVVPFPLEIDQHFIAAVLTVIGFSMNDTVIVFDRIREYFRNEPNADKKSVINHAINDTLSRTVMTAVTVFLTILILFIFGGEATRGFAFAMVIGVLTGTYSSIFVAAPVLVDLDRSDSLSKEVDHNARIEELKKMA